MGRDGGLLHTTRGAARPRCCRSLGRVARRDRLIFGAVSAAAKALAVRLGRWSWRRMLMDDRMRRMCDGP